MQQVCELYVQQAMLFIRPEGRLYSVSLFACTCPWLAIDAAVFMKPNIKN